MDVTNEFSAPDTAAIAEPTEAQPVIKVSMEILLYVALIALALVLRLPELGTDPLNDREAHEGLSAFRAVSSQPGLQPLTARDPLMFTANALIMSVAGGATGNARLPTAILGVFLVGSPILFRRWIGPAKTLIAVALLAISPVLLLSSRTMSGSVWSMACALIAAYTIGRFVERRRPNDALVASAALALLVLMAEPAGFVAALGLGVGLVFAASAKDEAENSYRGVLAEALGGWPWLRALIGAGIVLGLVGTIFMLYPRGLSGVGEVIGLALNGFVARPAGYPLAFPLLVSLLYEPVLWIFGLTGVYWLLTGKFVGSSLTEIFMRVMTGWLAVSLIAALLYQSAEPYHALWFTIPLVGLAAVVIEKALAPVQDRFWDVPRWGPFLHAAGVVAMLAITGINLVIVGRMIMNTGPDVLPTLDSTQTIRLVFILPAILLIVITFFLVGSVWGARAAWHGLGIGSLVFLAALSLGAGWHAAVVNADDPRELWQIHPAARNLNLMNTTLTTASIRVTGMPYDMQLLVVSRPDNPLPNDGALAWALHQFHNAQYVVEAPPSTVIPVIIQAQAAPTPQAGAGYVGQRFPVYYTWDRGTLRWDILAWLYDRESRVQPVGDAYVITWVRSDVYGLPNADNNNAPNDLAPAAPPSTSQ